MKPVNDKLLICDAALSVKGCQGVNSVTLFLSHSPASLTQMESCGSLKDSVGVVNSYPGAGRPSMALVHNGDVGGHRDRTSEACFPKQERKEVENGIPREAPSCRAEDGSKTQSQNETRNLSRSRSPSPENGFLLGQEDQDLEKDKDDSSLSPPPPHKKRGRRKLERPTKCKSATTVHSHTHPRCSSLFQSGGGIIV